MNTTRSLTLSLVCVGLGLIFVLLPRSINAGTVKSKQEDKQLNGTKTNITEATASNLNSTKTASDPTKCQNGNGGDAVGGDGGSNGENGADSQGQDCPNSRLKRGSGGIGVGGKGSNGGQDGSGKNGISLTRIENVQINADSGDDGGIDGGQHDTRITVGNISTE